MTISFPNKAGRAKITKTYNLPCKYILHTVGPIVYGELTKQHEKQLADCYRSCLSLADKYGLQSLAFCCISTGEFHFPNEKAAEIAVRTVIEYKTNTKSKMKVVFNVFKETDYPFWKMTYLNKNATYVCVNLDYSYCPEEIQSRSVCLSADIAGIIKSL